MKLIVGLGNPDFRYARTRHNVGFMVLESYAQRHENPSWSERWESRFARIRMRGDEVLLQEPLTYMNLSGHAVSALSRYFRIPPEDVLVIHDDLDLPLGRVAVKMGGGDGGHRGLVSVIEQMGTSAFPRVRVGIGRPVTPEGDVVNFVLSPFAAEEVERLEPAFETARVAIDEWVFGGVSKAQNRVNRKARPDGNPSCPTGGEAPGPTGAASGGIGVRKEDL